MTNKLYSLSLIGVCMLTLASAMKTESAKAQSVNFNQNTCIQGFVKEGLTKNAAQVWCNHKKDCLNASQSEGLPAKTAETVCDCAITNFRKKYTPEKFADLTTQSKTNPSIKAKLREVGEACFENILFE